MKHHEYSNEEITVIWKPELCKHAGICVKMLPEVYNPNARPWINLTEDVKKEEVINQVNACPSGALTYRLNEK